MSYFYSACVFRAQGYLSVSPVLFLALISQRHYRMHFVIATSVYQVISPIVFALEQHRGQQPGGMLDAQIRASGRLKANAFLPYIRTPSLGSSHGNQWVSSWPGASSWAISLPYKHISWQLLSHWPFKQRPTVSMLWFASMLNPFTHGMSTQILFTIVHTNVVMFGLKSLIASTNIP